MTALAVVVGLALPFRARSFLKRVLAIPVGILMAAGAVGFLGTALSGCGGLNRLPRSFEWPAGYAEGVISMPGGEHVVPLRCPCRIQVYDRNWRFLRGWHSELGRRHPIKLVASGRDRFEAIEESFRCEYTLNGDLILRTKTPTNFDAIPAGRSCFVPTPIWLWIFSSPFLSFVAYALGLILGVMLLAPRAKRRAISERNLFEGFNMPTS